MTCQHDGSPLSESLLKLPKILLGYPVIRYGIPLVLDVGEHVCVRPAC